MNETFDIYTRRLQLVNTDPLRRCYNGCHFSSDLVWTNWELLEPNIKPDRIKRRLEFWKELNDYAVSQRGKSAKLEFESIAR